MHYNEIEKKNIRGLSISRKNERAFHFIISIDTHGPTKDAKTEATGLLYVKALLAGCDGFTRKEFLDAVNLLGASISAGIDQGILSVSVTSIDTHREKILSIVKAMLHTPAFSPKEIVRIKELLSNELHEDKEDAKSRSVHALVNTLYSEGDRRHVSDPDILLQALASVTRKDIAQFHKHAMSKKWVFTVIGDTEHETKTLKKVEALRSFFTDAKVIEVPQKIQTIIGRKVELVSIPSKQNIELNIGCTLPMHVTDKEYYAFVFGLNVLGKWGGFAGRLMSTVREKEGLTYGIYARTETVTMQEQGYWRIMTFFAPDKAIQGLQSTIHQIERIHAKGITEDEYNRFKTILSTSQTLLRDSIIRTAGDMHGSQIKGLSLTQMEEHRKNMFNVTLDEVNDALKEHLNPANLVIAGAGPVRLKERELKALKMLEKAAK